MPDVMSPSWPSFRHYIIAIKARIRDRPIRRLGEYVSAAATYLEALNPEQRRAVEHGVLEKDCSPRSPLLVIAGAGSGKTNTLARGCTSDRERRRPQTHTTDDILAASRIR